MGGIMNKWDWMYLDYAKRAAQLSSAKRLKVGAVIMKDDIVFMGYNGMPSGMSNVCELEDGTTNPEVLHAESNAIAKIARSTISSKNATMYCTHSPCIECSKLMIQARIKKVIFEHRYRKNDGLALLLKAKVELIEVFADTKVFKEITSV